MPDLKISQSEIKYQTSNKNRTGTKASLFIVNLTDISVQDHTQ